MIAADAIAPGWAVVLVLCVLAIALFYCFAEGEEHQETLRAMGLGNGHARASSGPYDQQVAVLMPNERCVSCGLEVETYHYACQGHTRCLTECPRCGGELEEI